MADYNGKLRGKRAAVITYSDYPADVRVLRAAEALAAQGMSVDLLCIKVFPSDLPEETINGVNVFRLPIQHLRGSKWNYLWLYTRFFLAASWFLLKNSWEKKYHIVHVHNMPDVLVFTTLFTKLRGTGVILDLHDPMPELMTSIYDLKPNHVLVRTLRLFERFSIGFADLALTPNIAFKTLFSSRSCPPEKMQIVMNTPMEDVFDQRLPDPSRQPRNTDGEFRIMHHGSILHRHGIDLLVEAIAKVRQTIPGVRLDLYGYKTPFLDTVLQVAQQLGVQELVRYHGPKNPAEIVQAIRETDLGIIPNRSSSFTALNFPTRIFEYLALHRPVITPATTGIRDYFSDDELLMFTAGDVDELANKIIWVWQNPAAARTFVERGNLVYNNYLWSDQKAFFLKLVSGLVAPQSK